MSWIFVDDSQEEAQSFADRLAKGGHPVVVEVVPPAEARERLLTRTTTPDGVLMDVDLSAQGERGSGPGIAQDLRVKQRAQDIDEFPIVRFAGRVPVQRNVKGDPGSDDLFDLKILKEEFAQDVPGAQLKLIGLEHVYRGLTGHNLEAKDTLSKLLGLNDEGLARWSHDGFHDRLLSALQIAKHVAAGAFMRGFLTPTGLLVNETVLSYRLGVDPAASGDAWKELIRQLPFQYKGIASDYYPRWWARGLDDWWLDTIKSDRALVSLTIAERVETVGRQFGGLSPLAMPAGSAGNKPWRLCALGLESDPQVSIPVDPTEAVRFTPRADAPIWVDPMHASLRLAFQERGDFRLNRSDLERLQRKHNVK